MTLVTVDELTSYMGGLELTGNQRGIVEQVILPGVQQDLETYLNRPVEPVHIREGLRADEYGWVWLRTTPVHQILSVTVSDGTDITPTFDVPAAMAVLGDLRNLDEWGNPELYKYQVGGGGAVLPAGFYPLYGGLSRPFYRVDYVAGYNGYVNEGLKLDICRIAAREAEMQFDDTMSLRGGGTEAAQDSDNRPKGWTADELVRWDRLRRRVAV